MSNYFLFAGETSGDLHGSHLIQAIQAIDTSSLVSGVGGPRMRQQKFDCFVAMEEFQVMGLSDVLKALPKLWRLFFSVRNQILKTKPDAVILVDYPGFNLRLAKSLRKKGFQGKIIQYICPTVWAHGKNRISLLATYYDLLLTIFPFEKNYFSHTSLKVEYIGNPLVETIRTYPYQDDWQTKIGLPTHHEWIALFPGSRLGEITKHLPQQLLAAEELKKRHPHLLFAIACARDDLTTLLIELAKHSSLQLNRDVFMIPPEHHYDLMKTCSCALAKSGTVSLELALHSVPTVIHYELSLLNYLFAKYILKLKLPHYCIVNILEGQTIFPEFIGRNIIQEDFNRAIEQVYSDTEQRTWIHHACEKIKEQLGNIPTHERAATAVRELL